MVQVFDADFGRLAATRRKALLSKTALDALDAAMEGVRCKLVDFEPGVVAPCTPMGDVLAEAFDKGMTPQDWRLATHPNTPREVKALLRKLWETEVLSRFAERYRLA